ncbi:ATP-binding protein [Sphingomonas glacialis]|nr:ATP-binding protein [Sphingomonas glacialis]
MDERPEGTPFRAILLDATTPTDQSCDVETPVGKDARELAHDLNNVLQIIAGNLQLIALDVEGTPAAARIVRAFGGLDHGVRLTAMLLDRCRKEGGIASVDEVVDSRRLLDIVPLLQDAVGAAVAIDVDIPTDIWPVKLDFGRLQNALLNLAINARDAMQGRGRIVLAARNAPGGPCPRGDRMIITLEDNGEGIRPDFVEKIFAPFFTTKATGTGLGLAIVREFGRASRADIAVESSLGVGTAFHLSFPRTAKP